MGLVCVELRTIGHMGISLLSPIFFLNSDIMKVTSSLIDQMIALKREGMLIQSIADKIGVCSRTVNKYTKGVRHPNNPKIEFDFQNSNISVEKVEILGLLAAEGCKVEYVTKYWGIDKRRGKRYLFTERKRRVIFTNLNQTISDNFIRLMQVVYSYFPRVEARGDFLIHVEDIISDLLKYSELGCKTWLVPDEVLNSDNVDIKTAWVRGFADGDGGVSGNFVILYSTNKSGLDSVSKLLDGLNVRNYILGPYGSAKAYKLKVDPLRYSQLIGFVHPEKKVKLQLLVKKLIK